MEIVDPGARIGEGWSPRGHTIPRSLLVDRERLQQRNGL